MRGVTVSLAGLKEELKWTFTLPMTWLQGVFINLALAGFYRLIWTLESNPKYDTVLLYTVYFATFIMADITTTNIFGPDLVRTTQKLANGETFRLILLRKNLVQFLVVMLPILVITIGWTEYRYVDSELIRVIPGILYPMLLFLGIGNLISVLFIVSPATPAWRIANIRNWKWHLPVLVSYAIPFVIYGLWVYTDLPGFLNQILKNWGEDVMVLPQESALALLAGAIVIYILFTELGMWAFRRKGLIIWGKTDLPTS